MCSVATFVGPEDFAKGVGRGVKSLVSHTIHGVFGATAKVTGAVGSGLARLTADDDYIAEREAARRAAPRHAGDGLAQGAMSMGKGFFDGITGIVVRLECITHRGWLNGVYTRAGGRMLITCWRVWCRHNR